jgi:hypothetical glycosyl hydrolase
MGVRSANEETYTTTTRGHFVAGTFNAFASEVTELPNLPDSTRFDIFVDGQRFALTEDNHTNYAKEFHIHHAELTRSFTLITHTKKHLSCTFRRFVSLDNLHLLAFVLEFEADQALSLKIVSFIDGRISNSGSQHLEEKEIRIYDQNFMEYIAKTQESQIDMQINAMHTVAGVDALPKPQMKIARREVSLAYTFDLVPKKKLSFEKIVTVYCSRDLAFAQVADFNAYRAQGLVATKELAASGYLTLFEQHKQALQDQVWSKNKLELTSSNPFDTIALSYATLQLNTMTPKHDYRMGVAAKALSGEGYKGHSFWDTEIFIFPYFLFSQPAIAKQLLIYRYLGLEGARKKAKDNGYVGAMYPWEAAWPSDGEVTPVWGAVDVVTGKQTKILSGFMEQHISSDIIHAVWQYYYVTKDDEFMQMYGYEMTFDVANFWASRIEFCEKDGQYHINGVIGCDEYKEHVNNNAFTNYMAAEVFGKAIESYQLLSKTNPALLATLGKKIQLNDDSLAGWQKCKSQLYLPLPNQESVIAQDDTYLSKALFDLTPYRNTAEVGTLFDDYSLDQVNEMQVTKQADVVMLMFLLESLFEGQVKRANYDYYEPKTTHDSSLSYSTHAILASDLAHSTEAYEMFQKSCAIDIGPKMKSSNEGIHTASLGGIWMVGVLGFGGLRLKGEVIHLDPKLPAAWQELHFSIFIAGQEVVIDIVGTMVEITPLAGQEVVMVVCGKEEKFAQKISVKI